MAAQPKVVVVGTGTDHESVLESGRRRSARATEVTGDSAEESAPRAKRAGESEDKTKKKKTKKSTNPDKTRQVSSQQGGEPTFSKGAHVRNTGVNNDTDIQTTSSTPGQYLLNPQQKPSSRHHDSPVQTITKVILGHHGLLISEENEHAACNELLTEMAAAISKQLHSASFVSRHCISQMGDTNIAIDKKVTKELEQNLRAQISSAVNLADSLQRGDLIKRDELTDREQRAAATLLQATQKLAEMEKKMLAANTAGIDAIDKVLSEIYNNIDCHNFDGKAEVLASIHSKRLIVNPSAGIDYDKLQICNDISSVVAMQAATGAAMSPAKSQKYYDKLAEQMNELDENAARAQLIKLHGKVIGTGAIYDPNAAEDFPNATSEFKEKFGMSRMDFWKMKALEQRLCCPVSPGAAVDTEIKIAQFTSLQPSPTRRLTFTDVKEIHDTKGEKASEEGGNDLCLTKFDKSFDKQVDWSKPETAKILFSAADANCDITQFFCDFEEIMATRAPYTIYEEMLGRLKEPNIASAVREFVRGAIAEEPAGTVVEKRKLRIKSYQLAKKFLIEQYEDDERGAKLLQQFEDTKMATGSKIFECYVKYKMTLDKLRRQIAAVDGEMLSAAHFIRHFVAGLAPKLKQRLEESEEYATIKKDESKMNNKLTIWARAMQKASRPVSTLNTILEDVDADSNVDISTDDFKNLRSSLLSLLDERGKRKAAALSNKKTIDKKNKGGGKSRDPGTYVDVKEIQEKVFKNCYTTEEWKKRKQAREQNIEYSKNPELYNKDKLKGKLCCVKCRRVGHTANECKRGAAHMQAIMNSLGAMKGKAGQKKQLVALLKKLQ